MTLGKGILGRYALVLDTLATTTGGLTLTEIMQVTKLPQGTVHRLIVALLDVGYIEPLEGRKVYILAPRLLRMLHLGTPADVIANLVKPELNRLVEQFGETAFIAKMAGHEVISVAMAVPDSQGQSHVQPGRVMPLHATASGKAIFAYQDSGFIDDVLATPRKKFTENTLIDEAEIRADLKKTTAQGFAVCAEELDPGIYSYACPIHLGDAGVMYSVGLVGLSKRLNGFPPGEIISNLSAAAERISGLLSTR
ncbi:MAG: IclR family transcriptional regulator [Rhodospirillales bacterium]|nr:IclR family transcriptional regulator [Rhodospirillales bacterium]